MVSAGHSTTAERTTRTDRDLYAVRSRAEVRRTLGRYLAWLARQRAAGRLTPELDVQAERVRLTLLSLDQRNATQSKAFMQASKDDVLKFETMWRARNVITHAATIAGV